MEYDQRQSIASRSSMPLRMTSSRRRHWGNRSIARQIPPLQSGLAGAADAQKNNLCVGELEHNAVNSTAPRLEQRLMKLATEGTRFGGFGMSVRRRSDLRDRATEGKIQGNSAAHRAMHEPVEHAVHIRSGTLEDTERSAHG